MYLNLVANKCSGGESTQSLLSNIPGGNQGRANHFSDSTKIAIVEIYEMGYLYTGMVDNLEPKNSGENVYASVKWSQ